MNEPLFIWKGVVPKEIIGYIRKDLFMFMLSLSHGKPKIHIFEEDDDVWYEITSFHAFWFRDLDTCLADFAKFLMKNRAARLIMKEAEK